jgi:hypothetical protein
MGVGAGLILTLWMAQRALGKVDFVLPCGILSCDCFVFFGCRVLNSPVWRCVPCLVVSCLVLPYGCLVL